MLSRGGHRKTSQNDGIYWCSSLNFKSGGVDSFEGCSVEFAGLRGSNCSGEIEQKKSPLISDTTSPQFDLI